MISFLFAPKSLGMLGVIGVVPRVILPTQGEIARDTWWYRIGTASLPKEKSHGILGGIGVVPRVISTTQGEIARDKSRTKIGAENDTGWLSGGVWLTACDFVASKIAPAATGHLLRGACSRSASNKTESKSEYVAYF